MGASQYAFGLFILPIEENFGWTRTEISASLSFAAIGGLTAPLLGRAMDRFGARPILVLSLAVFGASFCLRPLMTELWHWYALSFLQFATFSGMTVLPAGRLIATWFPRTRGRMTGLAAAGNNVGGLVIPLAVAALLAAMSWSGASLAIGIATFAIATAAMLAIRESPSPNVPGHPTSSHGQAAPPSVTTEALRNIVHSRTFYAVLAAITLGTFTYSAILPHALAHMVNRGMADATALSALGSIAAAGIGGKLLFGWLSDRFTARQVMIANLVGQAVFAAFLAAANSPALLAIAAPLYGLFMGGFGALYILVVQESFDMRHFGSLMGLMNLGTVISFGVGPLIAGASYDISGTYSTAFLIVCGLFVAGAAALLFGEPTSGAQRETPPLAR